jgi:hypothetical protein
MTGKALAALLLVAAAAPAWADTANFELNGKIYTKYLYKNDNTQGCLAMSNPFWTDNIGGNNGACTEFELNIKARVGPRVQAGVRLQSRWGMIWQDWWENGDLKSVSASDTSGESMGMNHAAYLKLRGAFVRVAPPISMVRWVTVGATDYSMWNEWTIGKARYIDRDNGSGVFVEGDVLSEKRLSYVFGAMALPKLWAGPGWNTGLKDNEPKASQYASDWAFAAKLESRITEDLHVRAVGSWLQDWEADRYSPSLTGASDRSRGADHSVAWVTRFRGLNGTVDATYSPSQWPLSVSGLFALSSNYVNPDYATNLVLQGQGFSPVLFRRDGAGQPIPSNDRAYKIDVELFDPLKIGLSAKLEYFDIGAEYNAVMGSRREADVLLTDGIITGGFTRGGQLPTLNIANEFVDWDEPWFESCIGWRGATGVLDYVMGPLKVSGEFTYIGYNTNKQSRDVRNQYPDFLYTHGFTDTTAFTADADYANVHDRGKDPRSVYTEFQDRRTQLAVLNAQLSVPRMRWLATSGWYLRWLASLPPIVLTAKVKHVDDLDNRRLGRRDDDYHGVSWLYFGQVSLQPTNELKLFGGWEYTEWKEAKRNGTQAAGFYDVDTYRHTVRGGLTYSFGGANLTYTLEYFHKDLLRQPYLFDMAWNVVRSKATFEVAF